MEADWPKGYKMGRRKLVTILDKMIAQDLIKTLLSVLTVIVVIIVSRQFIRILDGAIAGQVSDETLLDILGLKTIVAAVEFLPVALFMSVLMVMGRMYRDHEMAAVASAGGGALTLYRAVFLLVVPLSILVTGLSLYVSPWAESRADKLIQHDEESADLRGIAAGKFSEYSHGDLVFYVEDVTADNKLHKVFLENRRQGNVSIINAESAHFEELPGGRYIFFENGEQVKGLPGSLNYVIEKFADFVPYICDKEMPGNDNLLGTPSAIVNDHSNFTDYTGEWGLTAGGTRRYIARIFINHDFAGGNLTFPRQKLDVQPLKDRLVLYPCSKEYVYGIRKIDGGSFYLTYWFNKA